MTTCAMVNSHVNHVRIIFVLSVSTMAHRMFFLIGCMTAVEHYIVHCKSKRCHFKIVKRKPGELPLAYSRFELKGLLVRKQCIGITFCEAVQAGCWLVRTAGYATHRGELSFTCFCVALCLFQGVTSGTVSTALWQKCWIP